MRISIHTNTGRILEMQSDATPGTLLKNAKASHPHIPADQIEEREVDRRVYAELVAKMPRE